MSAKPLGKGRGQHGRQRWLAKKSADMFCQAVWPTCFARKSEAQPTHKPDTTQTQPRHKPDRPQTQPRQNPDTSQTQPTHNPDTPRKSETQPRHNPDTPRKSETQPRHNPDTPGKIEAQPKHPLVCGGKSEIRGLNARLRSRSHSQHTWPLRHIRRQVIGPIAHIPSLSLSPVVDLGRVW